MRRLRIATTYKHDTANAHYRAIVPLGALARRGHTVLWPSKDGSFARMVLDATPSWNVTLMQQSTGEDDLQAVRRLREHGVAVVWDTDDDIRAVPRSSPAYDRFGGRRGLKRTFERSLEIARTSHLMTTPSEHLAAIYRAEGVEHVAVIENAPADDAIVHARRPRHAGVVIGCVAAKEHEDDLKRLRIGKLLKRLLGTKPGVSVTAIGCDLGLKDPRYRHYQKVPFEELRRLTLGFDIGIAPLADSPMSRGRSNVKLKEYAAAGAMWLASPLGPYRGMGETAGGLLVDDGDWLPTLEALVDDPYRRTDLMRSARAWVSGETISSTAPRWEKELRAAYARAS